MADIAILGSGGWGMALAVSAHLSGNNVTLWSPFDEEVKMLTEKRCNEKLLSGITLEDIHTLTVAVQPATMVAAHGSNLSAGQRDILRADEVRKALKALQ